MSEAQLNKRWQKLCADVAEEARRQGAKEPFIFACESGLCVLDGAPGTPAVDNRSRGHEVLFTLPKPPSRVVAFDAGGW